MLQYYHSEQMHRDGVLPGIHVRAASEREARRYLQEPAFSNCTVPVVFWGHHMGNFAHSFRGRWGAGGMRKGEACRGRPAPPHPPLPTPTMPPANAFPSPLSLHIRRQRSADVQCHPGDALGGARQSGADDGRRCAPPPPPASYCRCCRCCR